VTKDGATGIEGERPTNGTPKPAQTSTFLFSRPRPAVGPPNLRTSGHEMYLSSVGKQKESEINGLLPSRGEVKKALEFTWPSLLRLYAVILRYKHIHLSTP
jgi:hypothetical protein